jgi:outer membrane protein OmpA-like peptidoglycan-associated protein
MKTAIILFSTLLLLWIAGSSYSYLCKIRMDCCSRENSISLVQQSDSMQADTLQTTSVTPEAPIPPLHSIYFSFNKNKCILTTENNNHIELIKQYLTRNPEKKVLVTGHSDAIGPAWAKINISEQRANFIKRSLAAAGIEEGFIETISESDNKPLSDNNTSEGRAKNRRVEIQIQ